MRVVFIGAVEFSARALEVLIDMPIQLVGVCTLKESTFNTDHVDLRPIAEKKIFPYATPQILILKLISPGFVAWNRMLSFALAGPD